MKVRSVRFTIWVVAIAGMVSARTLPGQEPTADIAFLEAASVIRSVDFTNVDFSDLEPLRAAIGDRRFVILGEASHGDGITFEAKARVVRFLHEEMGFDVLAWEAGLLETEMLNRRFRAGEHPLRAGSSMMSGGWPRSVEVAPLITYVAESWRTETPVMMTGFDAGRPPSGFDLTSDVMRAVASLAPGVSNADSLALLAIALADRTTRFLGPADTAISAPERIDQRRAVGRLIRVLENVEPAAWQSVSPLIDHALALESLRSLLGFEQFRWSFGRFMFGGEPEAAWRARMVRDLEMATVLKWLADERYAERKIVVWAATSHLVRGYQSLKRPGASEYPFDEQLRMGDFFDRRTDEDDVYVIGFSAFTGTIGTRHADGEDDSVEQIGTAPPGSLESMAHATGASFLFVDFRSLPPSHELRQPRVSWMLGYEAYEARWPDLLDGLFFIDRMEPVSRSASQVPEDTR